MVRLLPPSHQALLTLLWKKAPSTEGVFRKPCNNKAMRLAREQLDGGHHVDMGDMNVANLVGLLKVLYINVSMANALKRIS